MSSLPQSSVKYVIKAVINSKGVVEKPDVIGAIFGQTEGLLGPDMDLRELQVHGKVGRIEVEIDSSNGSSKAEIKIPSGLDAAETAILAASLETIDRVGPCISDVVVEKVEDVRVSKRNYIVSRAQQILNDMVLEAPKPEDLSKSVRKGVDAPLKTYYGFYAGPGVFNSEEIILVEGRSDVLNLIEKGYDNGVALGGTSVPKSVSELIEDHEKVVLFLDGDRGGDLIKKEMDIKADYDFIARAPEGMEVEDLSKEEISSCLNSLSEPSETSYAEESDQKVSEQECELSDEEASVFRTLLNDIVGSRAACLLDENLELLSRVPVSRIGVEVESNEGEVYAVVFDGTLSGDVVSVAEQEEVQFLVGMRGDGASSEVCCLKKEDI